MNPLELSAAAAASLLARAGVAKIAAAAVLGSGWNQAVELLTDPISIPVAELPGFQEAQVAGHAGVIHVGQLASATGQLQPVALLQGRTHTYEIADPLQLWRSVHGVRTLAAAGAHTVVLTNAAGGIAPQLKVGQLVLLRDHINFSGRTPLVGPEFISLNDAYDPQLASRILAACPQLTCGVYAMMPGPAYETPAEIRMLATLGADVVGMSTVNEVIALRALGVRVAALSLVSNAAAGLGADDLSHAEVIAAGKAAALECRTVLAQALQLAADPTGWKEQ